MRASALLVLGSLVLLLVVASFQPSQAASNSHTFHLRATDASSNLTTSSNTSAVLPANSTAALLSNSSLLPNDAHLLPVTNVSVAANTSLKALEASTKLSGSGSGNSTAAASSAGNATAVAGGEQKKDSKSQQQKDAKKDDKKDKKEEEDEEDEDDEEEVVAEDIVKTSTTMNGTLASASNTTALHSASNSTKASSTNGTAAGASEADKVSEDDEGYGPGAVSDEMEADNATVSAANATTTTTSNATVTAVNTTALNKTSAAVNAATASNTTASAGSNSTSALFGAAVKNATASLNSTLAGAVSNATTSLNSTLGAIASTVGSAAGKDGAAKGGDDEDDEDEKRAQSGEEDEEDKEDDEKTGVTESSKDETDETDEGTEEHPFIPAPTEDLLPGELRADDPETETQPTSDGEQPIVDETRPPVEAEVVYGDAEHEREMRASMEQDERNRADKQRDTTASTTSASGAGQQFFEMADQAITSAINLTYTLYAGLVVLSLVLAWWCCSGCYTKWQQQKLKARRGYDDTDLDSFPKESTQGYAYDDGL